jgi:hypothetical protein
MRAVTFPATGDHAMRLLKSFMMLSLLTALTSSYAQASDIHGMPIRPGDTVEKVREAYQTKLDPESYDDSTNVAGRTQLRLKTKGVWFFFGKDGKIYTVRLDAPFAGSVNGVKIGDTPERMRQVLGKPIKTMKPFSDATEPDAFIYYLDDEMTANFHVEDGHIETVFLSK